MVKVGGTMSGVRAIEHAASGARVGAASGSASVPGGLALGERDLVRRLRANDAALIAAIEYRHRSPAPATGVGRRGGLGRRLRRLWDRGLVPTAHARAMFAALDLRNATDYRGVAPTSAGLAARIAEHRAVAAWAIARGYLRADQLEPVEPVPPPTRGPSTAGAARNATPRPDRSRRRRSGAGRRPSRPLRRR
jgi:hypothetical protein